MVLGSCSWGKGDGALRWVSERADEDQRGPHAGMVAQVERKNYARFSEAENRFGLWFFGLSQTVVGYLWPNANRPECICLSNNIRRAPSAQGAVLGGCPLELRPEGPGALARVTPGARRGVLPVRHGPRTVYRWIPLGCGLVVLLLLTRGSRLL